LEDIIGYIILFVSGLGALYLYQWRKDKIRLFPLSEQHYPESVLTVLILKKSGEIKSLVLRFYAKKEMTLQELRVEMISPENEIFSVSLNKILNAQLFPVKIAPDSSFDFEFEMDAFKDELTGQSVRFSAFRLVAQNAKGKKFKSHRLAFDKRWAIFKPDTGKYN